MVNPMLIFTLKLYYFHTTDFLLQSFSLTSLFTVAFPSFMLKVANVCMYVCVCVWGGGGEGY